MTKRNLENNIADFEESGRKLLKDPNSDGVKVEKGGVNERSELSFFIKSEKMISILKEKGIKSFFPIQYETFDHIYKGKDLIARDRTGSGKTLAFSLPVIERFRNEDAFRDGGRVKFLIVLPTREVVGTQLSWPSKSKPKSIV
jgi:superfamily II DNA/RNA helicase